MECLVNVTSGDKRHKINFYVGITKEGLNWTNICHGHGLLIAAVIQS